MTFDCNAVCKVVKKGHTIVMRTTGTVKIMLIQNASRHLANSEVVSIRQRRQSI